jgi:hypothetical protein
VLLVDCCIVMEIIGLHGSSLTTTSGLQIMTMVDDMVVA